MRMSDRPYIAILLACASGLFGCARQATPDISETPHRASAARMLDQTVSGTRPNDRQNPETAQGDPGGIEGPLSRTTLCATGERVLFACSIKDSVKSVALCASADVAETRGHLYYAYGTAGRKELRYPAESAPPTARFRRTHLGYAGSTGGYAYSFVIRGIKYVVYSISGANALQEHGVIVTRDDSRKPLASYGCSERTVVESSDKNLVDLTMEWSEDEVIRREGLPGRE
jgi:hypothetical protein